MLIKSPASGRRSHRPAGHASLILATPPPIGEANARRRSRLSCVSHSPRRPPPGPAPPGPVRPPGASRDRGGAARRRTEGAEDGGRDHADDVHDQRQGEAIRRGFAGSKWRPRTVRPDAASRLWRGSRPGRISGNDTHPVDRDGRDNRVSGQPSRMRSQSPWGPRSLPIAGFGPSPASACGGNLGSGNGLEEAAMEGPQARQHVIVDLSYPPADGAAPCWAVDCPGPTGGDSRPLQVENEGEELNQRQNQSTSGSPFRMPYRSSFAVGSRAQSRDGVLDERGPAAGVRRRRRVSGGSPGRPMGRGRGTPATWTAADWPRRVDRC